ncbi:trichohyalin isoform X2 [Gouania willdenowi]|nr:trichohyalin-like isoform X2 [Gouania willdenowi]
MDFKEFQTFGDLSKEHSGNDSAAVQTVRASLFDYFVDKQSVMVKDNVDIAKDSYSSLSFRRVDGEDERTLFTVTNKEPMSPPGPLQFLHAFETVRIVEENRTMNASVPLDQLENKAIPIQSKGNRSLTDKMSPEGQLALSMTTEQQPRFLRVGALPKWTMSGMDQNASIEKGMLNESQRETPMALDEERDQSMLPDEEMPKPRATYFALTGQIQEPSSLGDVRIAPIDVTLPISGVQGKSLPIRRNPSLDEAFDKSIPVRVEEIAISHLSARDKREREDFERIRQMALEQEMLRIRDLDKEKEREREMKHRLALNELAKKERIEAENKRELQKQTERHLIKMKELEREKQRQLEIEKQSHLEFARMKEMEMQREDERQRQKVFEKQKKEHERKKQAEVEKLKLQEREKEKQTELEKYEKQKAQEMQKQIGLEKQRLQELEREKQKEVIKERERQFEREKRREAETMQERERQREKAKQRQKEEERQKEMDKEQWLLEIQKEKQKMEELERIKEQERQQLREFKKQKQAEKERQELIDNEKQRQREKKEREEAEKIKQMALEQEMLRMRELDKERERQRVMEMEYHKEMERKKQRMEQERQQLLELQKQKQVEKERQQHIELEKERLREKKEKQEAEKIRRMVFEHEILRIKELEKEMEQQRELERQRQNEIEKERQRELEQQMQRDLERDRQRQLDFERQEMENQRLRQQEQQREKQRFEELERLKDLEKRQLMEFEKQKQADRERQRILELEICRLKEKMEREEAEKMRQIARQQEVEKQRLKEKQKKEEQERLKTSPLRPQVLDLDSVLRSDQMSKTTSPRSDPTTRWKEPYRPAILDIDSFSSTSQHSPAQDLFVVPSAQGIETAFGTWLQPTPERDVNWKVPSHASGGVSSPMWTAAPQDPWELQPVGMSVDKPIPEPRKDANNIGPEQLFLDQDDWLRHPQRLQDNPSQMAFILGAEAKTAHSSGGLSISAFPEHKWLPHELQHRDSKKDNQVQRWSQGSQELNRMRSRSVSRRSTPPDTLTEGNLSRVRSRSAHREQERHSWVQQKQSVEEESKDESRDSETACGDTDSQYGTWETGLRTDDSLTPATPSSESKSTSQHTPGDAASQAEADTIDGYPPPPSESQPLLFPDTPTALLDTSALRSRAQLAKKRAPRTRPSRAARQADADGGGPADWLYRDSTEATLENKKDESDSEEQARGADAGPAVSFQPQRVALFPGLDPLALKAQLKKRNDSDNQVDGPTSSPSQLSRSPKSPFLPRVARMLPPAGRKESGEEDSPQWLKELKSKKRMSQYENDSYVNN